MKHLLRHRSTSVSAPSPASSPSPSSASPAAAARTAAAAAECTRASHETPLYARFTGGRHRQDGARPLVSGPLALAPKGAGAGTGGQGRSPGPAPVTASAQAPPVLQQQKSSDSRRERKARPHRQDEESGGRRDEARRVRQDRVEVTEKEGEETEKSDARGADDTPRVRRMPSDGTALSAGSTSGLGRHGTRVDGERVLLPARKVTRKQPAEEGRDEKRAERSADPPSSSGRARGVGEQDAEVRVVGDRVLLPARKVTRKRAMKSEDAGSSPAPDGVRKDPADAAPGLSKASASTSSSARARAMQTSGTAHTSAPVAFPEGPPASPTGAAGAAGVSAPAVVVDRFSTPKGTPSDAKEQRAGSPPRVGGHAQAQDMAPGTSTPRVPSPTPQPSTSSSAAPARRRKYSLRAAFGLPELETGATGGDGQSDGRPPQGSAGDLTSTAGTSD
ncbi:hypothetical protein BC628DRAFT_1419184 [Trametes gibbosa]|nr:hypothetical protein BC628DRAFT_1419184 [Trametes gibbosa]